MSDVQRYFLGKYGLVEGEALGRLSVVLASDFDRVTAERDALQDRLNAADEFIDGDQNKKELALCWDDRRKDREEIRLLHNDIKDYVDGQERYEDLCESQRTEIASLTFQLNDREASRYDWLQAALAAEKRVEVLEGLLRDTKSMLASELSYELFEKMASHIKRIEVALSASADPNQCDGCQAGIPLVNGAHRMGKPGGHPDTMSCQAGKYASAEPSPLPDPLGCRACTHPECAKFNGPRQIECRAMADNACARPSVTEPSAPVEIEALLKEAERYRWLRDKAGASYGTIVGSDDETPEEKDAIVDEGMARAALELKP